MIQFKGISKRYGSFLALDGISFEIGQGEFASVVGSSGAGKSTLIKLLICEEEPTAGEIWINNVNVLTLGTNDLPLLRRKIGAIFQDFKLLPDRTIFENVAFALEAAGASDQRIEEDVPQVLKIVGLQEKMQHFPAELSGGEQQRAATARALIHRPDIIVADEPTGNLDPLNTWEIVRLLLKINEMGTTVLLASHNKEIINALKKRVITLKNGKVIRDAAEGRYIM